MPTRRSSAGTPADRLDDALAAGRLTGLHGVLASRHGRTILEYYGTGPDHAWSRPLGRVAFGPDVPHDVRSVTKSVVGLLYGIALDRGCVPEPGEPLLRGFPEYADLAADERRARLTVEHALTMTLGVEWNEDAPYTGPANSEIAMELAPDRHRFVLDRPITEEPGRRWSYCGGAAALLGRLIVKGTGRSLPAFARETLFGPLGITAVEWMAGRDGVASAASGLRMTPRDLARVGQVVLDGGRMGGRQVVPAGWSRTLLRPRVRVDTGLDYGYQWYLGAFPAAAGGPVRWAGAMGNGGQRLYVLPELDLVVAVTAGAYDAADQSVIPGVLMNDVILPGLGG